jgi:ABC-2 type transport system ATP-binding protein
MAKFKSMENIDFAKELVKRLNFDPKGKVKTMSKGMKQKLAIVVAFMNKPNVLILDEPTSGLDPLMQLEFDKIVLEFKQAGATILLSSHIFSEIEKVCDRVSIIKEGKKIMEQSLADIRHDPEKTFKVEFSSASEYKKAHARFVKAKKFHIQNAHEHKNQIIIKFHDEQTNEFTEILSDLKVKYIYQYIKTLEETFMKYYSNNHEYSFKELKTNLLKGKNA